MSSDPWADRLRSAGSVFAEEESALLRDSFTGADLDAAMARRIGGEPLEWILGFVDFAGRRFRVSPGVFIPRQRSLALVEEAVRRAAGRPGLRILDLCCGCGALGLAVQQRLPEAVLFASDLSPAAVADARHNGAAAEVGNLFGSTPTEWYGQVDILICNAPYVPSDAIDLMPRDSRDHESRDLVDGGADGLDVLRRVVRQAPDWLATDGRLHVECSPEQATILHAMAADLRARPFLLTATAPRSAH